MAEKKKPSVVISGISEDALETLAEALYPDILELFKVKKVRKNSLNGKQANRTRHKKTEQQSSCSVAFLKENEYQK